VQEAASRPADKEKLVQQEYNEGNLFGVRAIEHGYYGGVSQSRPTSPVPSSYRLAPSTTVVDWSKDGRDPGSSASSIRSIPQGPTPAKLKSSPLGGGASDAASVGGMGGAYLPPLPSPRANRTESPMFGEQKPAGWVNPLDVHYSRPTTPQPYRPTSYLPKLNLDLGQSGLLMPINQGAKAELPANPELAIPSPAVMKSPSGSPFDSPSSIRTQKPSEPVLPVTRDLMKGPKFENADVPLKNLAPKVPSVNPDQFPQDNRRWNPASNLIRDSLADRQGNKSVPNININIPGDSIHERQNFQTSSPITSTDTKASVDADSVLNEQWGLNSPTIPDSVLDAEWDNSRPIIRDSIVSKQRVSIQRPAPPPTRDSLLPSSLAPDNRRSNLSFAASSLYSNDDNAMEDDDEKRGPMHERMRSQVADFDFNGPSRSTSFKSSVRSYGQNRDSNILRHSRCVSDESLILINRRSQAQFHALEMNNESLESPFSNSNATFDSTHSTSSSFSSYISSTSHQHRSGHNAPPLPASMAKTQPTLPKLDLDNFPFPLAPQQQNSRSPSPARQDLSVPTPPHSRNPSPSRPIPPPPNSKRLQFEVAVPPPLPLPATQDLSRLSVSARYRGRSASEVSQNSIGEFYDSYFRQSVMNGQQVPPLPGTRNSVQERVQNFNSRIRSDSLNSPTLGIAGISGKDRDSRRPAPLSVGLKRPEETIIEVPSPRDGSFEPAKVERFPTRI
jgi:hypothetical protein